MITEHIKNWHFVIKIVLTAINMLSEEFVMVQWVNFSYFHSKNTEKSSSFAFDIVLRT